MCPPQSLALHFSLYLLLQVPIIVALRNPGMRARHWETLSEKIGKITLSGFCSNHLNSTESSCTEVNLHVLYLVHDSHYVDHTCAGVLVTSYRLTL